MLKSLLRYHRDEKAQTTTEYVILIFYVGLAFIGLGGIEGPLITAIRVFTDQIMFVMSLPMP